MVEQLEKLAHDQKFRGECMAEKKRLEEELLKAAKAKMPTK